MTGPTIEPLTLAEVKQHLRILHSSDDAYVMGLIQTAREAAEEETKRALCTQSWRFMLDTVPGLLCDEWWDGVREGAISRGDASAMEVPRPPLQSITSITAYNSADVGTVWDPLNYYVDTTSDPGRVSLRAGGVWPVTTRPQAGIIMDFVAGYPSAAAVPNPIKHGMLMLCAELYRNREHSETGALAPVPYSVTKLWQPYVVRL